MSTVLASPAAGATVECGEVITQDTALSSDVGPCPGDGIVVAADAITLDLNGHTISGDPQARRAPDKAGVLLRRVSGVTVIDGTVSGFDAGVAVMGGGGNTVQKITAKDNVNYRVLTGRDAPEDTDPDEGPFCDFGEGIAVFNSNDNTVAHNTLVGNGPFAGLSLVYDSNGNTVTKNKVIDNDVINLAPGGEETSCGLISPGDPPGGTAREVQDAGVRVEGPGAERNLVEGNQIRRSGLAGIFVNGFNTRISAANRDNVLRKNTISETGKTTYTMDYRASGIQLHDASPRFVWASYNNTVEGNNASRNFGSGIEVSGGSGPFGNIINRNVVNHNGLDGVHLEREASHHTLIGNRGYRNGYRAAEVVSRFASYPGVDGADNNADCDDNVWSRNRFGTVNQACVAANGTGWIGGPGRSGAAQGADGGPLRRGKPTP